MQICHLFVDVSAENNRRVEYDEHYNDVILTKVICMEGSKCFELKYLCKDGLCTLLPPKSKKKPKPKPKPKPKKKSSFHFSFWNPLPRLGRIIRNLFTWPKPKGKFIPKQGDDNFHFT